MCEGLGLLALIGWVTRQARIDRQRDTPSMPLLVASGQVQARQALLAQQRGMLINNRPQLVPLATNTTMEAQIDEARTLLVFLRRRPKNSGLFPRRSRQMVRV